MNFKDSFMISLMDQRYFDDYLKLSSTMINFLYDDRFSFVVEFEGRVIGSILAEKCGKEVNITSLCIEYRFSDKGLGKLLLNTCIEEICKIEPDRTITLMVSKENTKARNLYQKFGFVKREEIKNAYFDGTDGYIMEIRHKNP